MTNHSINLNTYYTRKSDYADKTDLVSNANGPDTSSHSGLMTPEQKTKLDGIEASANNYVHPNNFTGGNLGLYKIATNTNGHVTEIFDTHLLTNMVEGVGGSIGDSLNNLPFLTYNLQSGTYWLFTYNISQLLADHNDGKVLSTNDYTTAEKNKLASLSNADLTNNVDKNNLVDELNNVVLDLIELGE